MNPSDTIEVTVERPGHGGVGVARLDGQVVFVRGALPGERVRARITQRKSQFLQSEAIDIRTASPHRVARLCPAAAAGAGCCDFDFIDPAVAPTVKSTVLTELLRRIGKLTLAEPVPVRSLGEPTGWRTRTRLGVDEYGAPGLRARGDSTLITAAPCAAPAPAMMKDLAALGLTPGAEVLVAVGSTGIRSVSEVHTEAPVAASGRRAAQRRRAPRQGVVVEVDGPGTVHQQVGDTRWELPLGAFWQAHVRAPETYSTVVRHALEQYLTGSGAVVWDLYGGAGVFSAVALEHPSVAAVHLVEADAPATAAAAAALDDDRLTIEVAPVAAVIDELPAPGAVIVDPPRSGCGDKVVGQICAADPAVVVHIGCDPSTFARDLKSYVAHGYRVEAVEGFDAFPLTHHIEAIAVLRPAFAPR